MQQVLIEQEDDTKSFERREFSSRDDPRARVRDTTAFGALKHILKAEIRAEVEKDFTPEVAERG